MDEILKGKQLLVVDDTSVARMLVADILAAAGVAILEAETGEEALRLAKENAVDAFLLDIRLPDMNGIEVCRALRAMKAYRNAPIVFVTAVDQREVLQWAIEAGADDFIQKPLHAMVLRRRLANLLEKADYVKQAESMSLALRRYISPRTQTIARLYATTGALPAPVSQDACVLFSDARGFTELGRELEPEALFEALSGALAAQVEIVNRHDGYVDKFAGDGVMAVFDSGGMAAKCCRCALDTPRRTAWPESAWASASIADPPSSAISARTTTSTTRSSARPSTWRRASAAWRASPSSSRRPCATASIMRPNSSLPSSGWLRSAVSRIRSLSTTCSGPKPYDEWHDGG